MHRSAEPELVVQVASAKDVSVAVVWARDNNKTLSVLAGGHNSAGRGVRGQLVIDLGRLAYAHLDTEAIAVSVGGGATWQTVDWELSRAQMCTPGGVVHSTGVVGLALGGGWGYTSKQHGLVCDNVVSLQLVLASGEVVTASASQRPELFWAARGGGPQFGICTQVVLKVYPAAASVYHGLMVWPIDKATSIVEAISGGVYGSLPDTATCFPVLMYPDPSQPEFLAVALLVYCEGGEAVAAPLLKPIMEAAGEPAMNMCAERSYLGAQQFAEPLFPPRRAYWKSTYGELTQEMLQVAVSQLRKLPASHDKGRYSVVAFENYWKPGWRHSADNAFAHTHAKYLVLANASWEDPECDEQMTVWARETHRKLQEAGAVGGAPNFTSEDSATQLFGAQHSKRIQEVKDAVDPDNFFRFHQMQVNGAGNAPQ